MANFIIIVDPDPERRSHFTQTIEPLLPPVEGLTTNSCAAGDFQAIWAANPNAPISCVAEQDGAAVIWGEAIVQFQQSRIDADRLRTLWKESPSQGLPPFDGFYAAVAYHPHCGLAVAADLLGLFPIYYYTQGEVALVASSPELFRYHPLFKAEFNPAGLVGILLTNGLVDGQTLWQHIRRLEAGHLLTWQPETSPKEVRQYQIPGDHEDRQYAKLSFSDHLEVLELALDQAIARQAPVGSRYCLLLTGGLDSRMLGGFLRRQGVDPVAFTLGICIDLEMQCAIPVARTLGLEHHTATIPLKQYPFYAELLLKWEHLANGFNWPMDWGVYSQLSPLAPKFISGRAMGPIGGSHFEWAYCHLTKTYSFEGLLKSINRWGFPPQLLERLLRKEVFGDLVQDTLVRIREVYQNYSELESKRIWSFYVYHRDRFHIGSFAWQLCFGAWPILPILDWQLLETTAVLPVETLDKRLAQKQLLCRQFPELAKLPLDRNDFYVEPLLPTKTRQQLARLFRLQQKWRRWLQRKGYDQRYYYRIYDINNTGWKAVRQKAEPYREQVRNFFHEDVLNEVLPAPELPVQFNVDSIIEASAPKALLGFLLWSKNNL
jgi:asparagine synthase (glutamine-hydrolysing)